MQSMTSSLVTHSQSSILGDSGGNVSIFQGGSVGHCEKKSSQERVFEWLSQ